MASGDFVSIQVRGYQALEAQLLELKAEFAVKAMVQAARRAFKPVLEAARQLVSTNSGDLMRAIRLSAVQPKSGDTIVRVGLRIAAGKGISDEAPPARRWHFVEFGTAFMAAHPFLRPALDQNAEKVLELLKTELMKAIQRVLKKGGGRA